MNFFLDDKLVLVLTLSQVQNLENAEYGANDISSFSSQSAINGEELTYFEEVYNGNITADFDAPIAISYLQNNTWIIPSTFNGLAGESYQGQAQNPTLAFGEVYTNISYSLPSNSALWNGALETLEPYVTSLQVLANSSQISENGNCNFTCLAFDNSGNLLDDLSSAVNWTVSDPNNSMNGNIYTASGPQNIGTWTVTATYFNLTATVSLTVSASGPSNPSSDNSDTPSQTWFPESTPSPTSSTNSGTNGGPETTLYLYIFVVIAVIAFVVALSFVKKNRL
jgi:hypothetical protein